METTKNTFISRPGNLAFKREYTTIYHIGIYSRLSRSFTARGSVKGGPPRNIVRIEFSPVVEIGTSKGHNLLQETTHEGLTLSYA